VTDLPEGSLLYELIDVHEFTERCCELLKEEGVDVWYVCDLVRFKGLGENIVTDISSM
jgi:hypothetical protein